MPVLHLNGVGANFGELLPEVSLSLRLGRILGPARDEVRFLLVDLVRPLVPSVLEVDPRLLHHGVRVFPLLLSLVQHRGLGGNL